MSTFPETRLRRLRRTGALRSLVRETKLDRSDFVYPLFVGPVVAGKRRAARARPVLGRRPLARGRGAARPRALRRHPLRDPGGEGRRGLRRVRLGRDRPASAPRAARALSGSRPDHGRLSLRVHLARALRRDRERRGGKRRHAGAARPDRGQPRRGRRGRRGAERHDGRAGRCAPGRARRGRLRGDGDHLVRRQVRLRLLRAVPRGRGIGSVLRGPSRVPDGSRERARGAPRVRARRGRGCGRADHQAGAPESRRDPRRPRVASTCPSPPTTSPASTRW